MVSGGRVYLPVRAGAWTRWLTNKTGLQPLPIVPKAQPLPLPEIIARQARIEVPATRSERRKPRWGVPLCPSSSVRG